MDFAKGERYKGHSITFRCFPGVDIADNYFLLVDVDLPILSDEYVPRAFYSMEQDI